MQCVIGDLTRFRLTWWPLSSASMTWFRFYGCFSARSDNGHPKRRDDYKRLKAHFKALIWGDNCFYRSSNQIPKTPAGFAAGVYDDGMQKNYGTSPLSLVLTTIYLKNVA